MLGELGDPSLACVILPQYQSNTHSRHPNFCAEQCLWWTYHLLSYAPAIASAGTKWHPPHVNWTIVGPVLLSLLFLGSTGLTEKLSMQKYPKYKRYQKTTSRLLPWFPGGHTD